MMSLLVEQWEHSASKSGEIDVTVLSPSELYRCAWRSLLESFPFVELVNTAAADSELTLPRRGEHPRLILVDAPGSENHLALQLGRYYDRYYLFFVVNDYDLGTILPLLKQGVTGFTSRSDTISSLAQVLQKTATGAFGLPPDVANRAVTALARNHRRYSSGQDDLTRRETEVLQLLADGMSNRDIAQVLFLSVRTVEAHLRNLYGKLEVNSRTEAALWAVRHGYEPLNQQNKL
jgi:DNA-binding NarL/FixJ family response regulator